MPPVGKPLKNDGPACRVCRCTEHNACIDQIPGHYLACSWVRTEGATAPLCSACSGTELDAIEVLNRLQRHLKQHGTAGEAFAGVMVAACLSRWRRRQKGT